MTATYPSQIKQFVAHRNNVEDIDASHVNAIQEEVSAIETVLGSYPEIDNSLNFKFNDYGTVRSRLEQMQRGKHIPACQVQRTATQQQITNNVITNMIWNTTASYDPFNMFSSGTDIVLLKTGWWSLWCDVAFSPHNDNGLRQNVLYWANAKGTNPNVSTSWAFLTGNNVNNDYTTTQAFGIGTSYGLSYQGILPKGAIIRELVQQQAGLTLGTIGSLAAICLREQ